ncbi:phage baseplate assembly protein V [Blastomonas sp.]|uniref:phage baseplate assembly protein V n=1 Tax=Blastomonas sp. TaxID=1909299 RepID=UPI0017ACCA0B|nr:phage baseplate assembly protein [Blastomonas sp.]
MSGLRRYLQPLEGRVRGMVGRAIVRLVDDATKAQSVQIELLEDETQDAVERYQDYGFTSVPHPGAEAVAVAVGGLRSHMIVIKVEDRRYRLTGLEAGEVALFDDLGQMVKLGRERIEIVSETEVKVTAPKVIVESDDVHLGAEGGQKVARIGDDVDLATGKIISGSNKVRAA